MKYNVLAQSPRYACFNKIPTISPTKKERYLSDGDKKQCLTPYNSDGGSVSSTIHYNINTIPYTQGSFRTAPGCLCKTKKLATSACLLRRPSC